MKVLAGLNPLRSWYYEATMFGFGGFFGIGGILVIVAILHFIRKRPDFYWLWIILLLGPVGALIYLAVEALPELTDPGTFKFVARGSRKRELEAAVVDNPSAGNYEELGQIYLDEEKWAKAKDAYDRAISSRTDSIDPFYRRGVAEIELGMFDAALPDLQRAVAEDPRYDFQRSGGLLAYAYWKTGQPDRAAQMFEAVTRTSTLTETQYHYAEFLAAQGKKTEARQLLDAILAKRRNMPGFQKRRDRPWFRKTKALRDSLPAI
jgi:hypothetical protein